MPLHSLHHSERPPSSVRKAARVAPLLVALGLGAPGQAVEPNPATIQRLVHDLDGLIERVERRAAEAPVPAGSVDEARLLVHLRATRARGIEALDALARPSDTAGSGDRAARRP